MVSILHSLATNPISTTSDTSITFYLPQNNHSHTYFVGNPPPSSLFSLAFTRRHTIACLFLSPTTNIVQLSPFFYSYLLVSTCLRTFSWLPPFASNHHAHEIPPLASPLVLSFDDLAPILQNKCWFDYPLKSWFLHDVVASSPFTYLAFSWYAKIPSPSLQPSSQFLLPHNPSCPIHHSGKGKRGQQLSPFLSSPRRRH